MNSGKRCIDYSWVKIDWPLKMLLRAFCRLHIKNYKCLDVLE